MNSIPYMNRTHVAGFVGNDPQLRFLPAGDPVLSLRVATRHYWKDLSGEWQSATEWHTVIFYRQFADLANSFGFKKGDFVDLEGRHHTREWQDDSNRKHASREIIVERFHRVDLSAIQKHDEAPGSSQEIEESPAANLTASVGPDSLDAFRKLT